MYRAPPQLNKILTRKWVEMQQQKDKIRLLEAKPTLGNLVQPEYPHLNMNRKKKLMDAERVSEIQKENKVLLEKLTGILGKNNFNTIQTNDKQKSLNSNQRKSKLLKITIENQAMLKRIISKKSAYPHLQYEKESRQNKYRVENICQYPYQLGRNTSPDYKYNSNNAETYRSKSNPRGQYQTIGNRTHRLMKLKECFDTNNIQTFHNKEEDQSVFQTLPQPADKGLPDINRIYSSDGRNKAISKIAKMAGVTKSIDSRNILKQEYTRKNLYRGKHQINGENFLINIYVVEDESMFLTAFGGTENYVMTLSITKNRVRQIMQQFGYDYSKLADSLHRIRRKLLIQLPGHNLTDKGRSLSIPKFRNPLLHNKNTNIQKNYSLRKIKNNECGGIEEAPSFREDSADENPQEYLSSKNMNSKSMTDILSKNKTSSRIDS